MQRFLDFDPTTRQSGPRLGCPIPPAIHPDVVAAGPASIAWALRMGLTAEGTPRFAVLERARFAWLAARCYPRVSRSQLQIMADLVTFLFFYDDLVDAPEGCDDHRGGHRGDAWRERVEDRIVAALRDPTCAEGDPAFDEPHCRAILDIRRRLAVMLHPGWLRRVADDMELYFQGVRWERAHERRHEVVSLATYRHLRPMISACNLCFDLAGAFACPDDPSLGRDPLVRELERIANNHVSWVNDIFSLDRELAHGQSANVVVALARSEGLAMRQALDRAIEVTNEELATFVQLEARLDELGMGHADPYVAALATWMRGSLDWHAQSDRYRRSSALTTDEGAAPLAPADPQTPLAA